MTIESPCILVCSIDRESGWCHGCGRTTDEIMGWAAAEPAWRRSIMGELPDRLARLPKRERRVTKRRAPREDRQ